MSKTEKSATELQDDALDEVAGGEHVSLNFSKIEPTYDKIKPSYTVQSEDHSMKSATKIGKPKPKGMERVFDDE
ncbi:MAG: hypothetical protein AAGC79_04895 [Pseudomonadota bacterium]